MTHYLLALVAAVIATSLTDWYFMGVLFHDRYLVYPDTWRHSGGGKGESLAVAWSTLLSVVTCAVFIWLSAALGALAWGPVLKLAVGIWLLGPVPIFVTNGFFIKIHPLNTLAMCLGWLAKLSITAVCAHLFLG
jgi:hypothetical protein